MKGLEYGYDVLEGVGIPALPGRKIPVTIRRARRIFFNFFINKYTTEPLTWSRLQVIHYPSR